MLAALAHKPARETGAHMALVQMDTSAATSTNIFPACSGIETAIVALRIHGRANAPVYKSHSFTHSLPPSFTCSLTHSFTHSLLHSPTQWFHQLTHPATTNPLICSFTCSPVCSFTRSCMHSFFPGRIHPPTHSLLPSLHSLAHRESPTLPQSPTIAHLQSPGHAITH